MLNTVYLNDGFLPREQACLPVGDLAVLRGYGVFDYFRYVAGRPRFVDDHWSRFERSAALLDLPLPLARAEALSMIDELIDRNGGGDGAVRLVLTGGVSPNGYRPATPHLIAIAYAHHPPPEQLYEQGARVWIHEYERQLPQAKTIDYIEGIRLLPTMQAGGFDYPLYLDRSGYLRESDRSNFMIVRKGVLITPVEQVLLGVTRLHVLRLAQECGIKVEERNVSLSEFLAADEAIITSTTKGVMPITSSDRGPIASGRPGEVTRQLMQRWAQTY